MLKSEGPSPTDARRSPKWLPWLGGAGLIVIVALLVLRSSGNAPKPSKPTSSATVSAVVLERPTTARTTRTATATSSTKRTARRAAEERADGPSEALPQGGPDTLGPLKAAQADPSERGTDALIAALKSPDAVVVAEATKTLIERRATRAIDALAEIELSDAAGSGLSIIDALGRLGALADGDERTQAVERLLAQLASEKQRAAPESPGNLLQLYEALGRTGDARAAKALEQELVDPEVGRAPKVVIVQSLVWLAQASSRAALEQARKYQAETLATDDFDAELRSELLAAIDAALMLL
jgi:hypothetical protein